jgi:hypothetical protein
LNFSYEQVAEMMRAYYKSPHARPQSHRPAHSWFDFSSARAAACWTVTAEWARV